MRGCTLIGLAIGLAIGLVIGAGQAHARKPPGAVAGAVIVPGPERTAVDWSRGLITAVGAAAGDLRAPSAAVARVAARRKALEQARARLDARARALTLGARPVAEWVRDDARARARLERALDQAVELDVAHASDGSVVVTAGLGLEAIRLAVHGPPRPGPADRAALPTAILIDARKVMNAPILGMAVNTPAGPRAAPTVYYRSLAAARADTRLGDRVLELSAAKLGRAPDALEPTRPGKQARLQKFFDSLDQALETGTLVVIVIGK
jgi:hypothetical protein